MVTGAPEASVKLTQLLDLNMLGRQLMCNADTMGVTSKEISRKNWKPVIGVDH
jgi:hypothetical protein